MLAGDPIPPNPENQSDFPEIPTIERLQELFAIDIDTEDPKWEGFAIIRAEDQSGGSPCRGRSCRPCRGRSCRGRGRGGSGSQ